MELCGHRSRKRGRSFISWIIRFVVYFFFIRSLLIWQLTHSNREKENRNIGSGMREKKIKLEIAFLEETRETFKWKSMGTNFVLIFFSIFFFAHSSSPSSALNVIKFQFCEDISPLTLVPIHTRWSGMSQGWWEDIKLPFRDSLSILGNLRDGGERESQQWKSLWISFQVVSFSFLKRKVYQRNKNCSNYVTICALDLTRLIKVWGVLCSDS